MVSVVKQFLSTCRPLQFHRKVQQRHSHYVLQVYQCPQHSASKHVRMQWLKPQDPVVTSSSLRSRLSKGPSSYRQDTFFCFHAFLVFHCTRPLRQSLTIKVARWITSSYSWPIRSTGIPGIVTGKYIIGYLLYSQLVFQTYPLHWSPDNDGNTLYRLWVVLSNTTYRVRSCAWNETVLPWNMISKHNHDIFNSKIKCARTINSLNDNSG